MTIEEFLQNTILQRSIVQCCDLDMKEFRESGILNREDTLISALDWYYGWCARIIEFEETDG